MPTHHDELRRLFDENDGLLVNPLNPALVRLLHRMAAAGSVRRLLPGIFCRNDLADDPATRIRALAAWLPDAVMTGDAAARWTFWPERMVSTVTAAHRRSRVAPPGFALSRQLVPVELRWAVNGVQVTCPALTALDLASGGSGEGIDRALLTRACSLADMHEALRLTPGRADNHVRRAVLHDSRDEPWSEAERLAHALLRTHGIRGWQTNVEIRCGNRRYYADLAFAGIRLVIEIDGFAAHSQPQQFHRDRQKWTDLTVAGWQVLHFTWAQLLDEPEWVIDTVRATLARLTSLAR